jgi:hypothetical protein
MLFPAGGDRIRLLSLAGGEPCDLIVKGSSVLSAGPYWAPNATGLYVPNLSARGAAVLYVDLKANATPIWEQAASSQTWRSPRPTATTWQYWALVWIATCGWLKSSEALPRRVRGCGGACTMVVSACLTLVAAVALEICEGTGGADVGVNPLSGDAWVGPHPTRYAIRCGIPYD